MVQTLSAVKMLGSLLVSVMTVSKATDTTAQVGARSNLNLSEMHSIQFSVSRNCNYGNNGASIVFRTRGFLFYI